MSPSQPISMSINPYRPYSNHLLCVTQLGTVAVWNITTEGMNNTVPHTIIQSKSQFLRAAQFVSDTEIVVIYGPKTVFQMETVKYFVNNEFVEKIELEGIVSLLPQEQLAKKKQRAMEPDRKKARKHVSHIGPHNMKLPTVTTTDVELLPFGERLAPLVLPTSQSQPTYNLRLESMENVLVQGLKSRDISLVNSVLSVTLPEIIKKTVQKLPQAYVVPYMTLLIKQFPENSSTIPWIQELIHHHLTFLMTVPQFVKKFSYLYGILDGRVANFGQLVKTKSRLEYLMSQKSYQPDESKKYIMVTPTPLKVYNEVEQADPVWNEWAVYRDSPHERKSRKRKRGVKNIVGLVEGDVDEDEDEEQAMERVRERQREDKQSAREKEYLENQLWMVNSEEEEEEE
uniref:Small-subunit processome Utp12 domain-containing protein n=1 Tax=Arcella intermedia TaxID=1963864 RepID=A0A6B2L5G5_9EUKA